MLSVRKVVDSAIVRLATLVLLTGTGACGTTGKSYIPVDSPLRPWQAPENLAEASPAPAQAPAPTPAPPPAPAAEKAKGKK
jgi:hypothetical protein